MIIDNLTIAGILIAITLVTSLLALGKAQKQEQKQSNE